MAPTLISVGTITLSPTVKATSSHSQLRRFMASMEIHGIHGWNHISQQLPLHPPQPLKVYVEDAHFWLDRVLCLVGQVYGGN